MNEDFDYRAKILIYAQTFLHKYPRRKLQLRVSMIVFSVVSVIILAQLVMSYVLGSSCNNEDADIAWSFVFLSIPIVEWNFYKALKRQETLCQAIVYLSKGNTEQMPKSQ
jgi:MFS-type transporter involved in bile tolerance (Atg22 family)